MGSINRTPIFINTFTNGAADMTITGNYLNILLGLDTDGTTVISTKLYWPGGSANGGVIATDSITLGAATITPTATTAGLTTAFVITQINTETNLWQSYTFQHTSGTSETATTICTALNNQILAQYVGSLRVTTSSGATLAITATSASPVMYVTAVSNCSTSAVTIGDTGRGLAASLSAQYANQPIIGNIVSGATYWTLNWSGVYPDAPVETSAVDTVVVQPIYFKTGGTNVSAAVTQLNTNFTTVGV